MSHKGSIRIYNTGGNRFVDLLQNARQIWNTQ